MAEPKTLREFGEMVATLFKEKDFNPKGAGIMHASIGVMGEVLELRFYDGVKNFVEEAGDLEFYLVAVLQQLDQLVDASVDIDAVMHTERLQTEHAGMYDPDVVCFDVMLKRAEKLLDRSKKIWVYNNDAKGLVVGMAQDVGVIRAILNKLYRTRQISRADVLLVNQEKLAKRYPQGVYSDTNAQQRLDKEGVEA